MVFAAACIGAEGDDTGVGGTVERLPSMMVDGGRVRRRFVQCGNGTCCSGGRCIGSSQHVTHRRLPRAWLLRPVAEHNECEFSGSKRSADFEPRTRDVVALTAEPSLCLELAIGGKTQAWVQGTAQCTHAPRIQQLAEADRPCALDFQTDRMVWFGACCYSHLWVEVAGG